MKKTSYLARVSHDVYFWITVGQGHTNLVLKNQKRTKSGKGELNTELEYREEECRQGNKVVGGSRSKSSPAITFQQIKQALIWARLD